jgi:hypothetical protein
MLEAKVWHNTNRHGSASDYLRVIDKMDLMLGVPSHIRRAVKHMIVTGSLTAV